MRLSSWPSLILARRAAIIPIWPLLSLVGLINAINFDAVPPPNLDLSQLGRVGLVGEFDSISLYSYTQQSQRGFSTNGSQAILTPLPNGAFAPLVLADAYIQSMCPFVMENGVFAGVVVGGNFTSLDGVEAQGVAMFNASSAQVTPLPGLSGKVTAMLCDRDTNTVYVGGEFRGANSTNAIAWVGLTGWANLPFAGFNGPVNTIAKASDGHIIFGGSFDGLGNSTGPTEKDQQVVNIASANVSAGGTTTTGGFGDPKSIVCNKNGQDGPDRAWLLSDETPGHWRAEFRYGFRPTKLRLWNTRHEGRGTKIFRFTALPLNGIMNLTYTDPASGTNASCDARCPLPSDPKTPFQDFSFVNDIGMDAFQIDISEWYGSGGGLAGIELFQDDIYAFAINDFNEPACADSQFRSSATTTGSWVVIPSGESASDYLRADSSDGASVVFTPDIKESGNYSVTLYTPGCIGDDTCPTRGRVNVTGTMATGTRANKPLQTELFQTNDFDKYDTIYEGYVDANGGSFRPTVTLTPSTGQSDDVRIVAQRVGFQLKSSMGGLNGLYEYDPNLAVVDTNFTKSAINRAGMDLDTGAVVSSVIVQGDVSYVGGNFSSPDFENVFAIRDGESKDLGEGGLNGEVIAMHMQENLLYVGGNYTNANNTDIAGLNNIAAYSTADNKWQALGAGVSGAVHEIVPVSLNISDNRPETVVSLTGNFDEILAFGDEKAVGVQGFAVWVPSRKNWLAHISADTPSLTGQLTAATNVPGDISLVAGSLSSQGLNANGAVTMPISGPLSLNKLPLRIQPRQPGSTKTKRAVRGEEVGGVATGYFYEAGDRNMTILGGHFVAQGRNGSTVENLAFVNGARSNEITGLGPGVDPDSTFLALTVHQDVLYAGGAISGNVQGADLNGLLLYDLVRGDYAERQPPALSGEDVSVHAVATRPNTGDVYVGGNFDSAGSLDCPSLCIFTTSTSQWNRPADGISGSVGVLAWSGADKLIVGGNLTVGGNSTSMATYAVAARQWTSLQGGNSLPGPVTALSAARDDASQFWVAGASSNGSTFLMKYNGSAFEPVGDLFGPATRIRGLQVLSVSKNHEGSRLVDANRILLVTGLLDIPNFGNASAALFNGTTFQPFILTNMGGAASGSLSQFISQKQNFFKTGGGGMAVGLVVLIGLAIALGLICLLVIAGVIAERLRRKREGYLPAPTHMHDRNSNMERIPPSYLFSSLGQRSPGPGGGYMI